MHLLRATHQRQDRGEKENRRATAKERGRRGTDLFGDINIGTVSRQSESRLLSYGLLTESNTKPRTTYLAKLRNPTRDPRTEDGIRAINKSVDIDAAHPVIELGHTFASSPTTSAIVLTQRTPRFWYVD
jgi:hypothetical protein